MSRSYSEALDAALAPALEAYGVEIQRHIRDFDPLGGRPRCRCGWTSKGNRMQEQAVGIHVKAAMKRASKTYDAAVDEAISREFDEAEAAARSAR